MALGFRVQTLHPKLWGLGSRALGVEGFNRVVYGLYGLQGLGVYVFEGLGFRV